MSDLISRQAAIDALEKVAEMYPWRVPGDCDSYSQYNEAWQDALNRAESEIEALPSAQAEVLACGEGELSAQPEIMKWILCSERLPEGTVLATVETKMFKYKYICEAVWIPRWSKIADFDSWEDCSEYNEDEDEYYVLEGWYERIHNWDEYSFVGIEDKVIAWKPLPQPYNKVEKGT